LITSDEDVLFEQIQNIIIKFKGSRLTFNTIYKLIFLLSPLFEEQLDNPTILSDKKEIDRIIIKYINLNNKCYQEYSELKSNSKIIHINLYNQSQMNNRKIKKTAIK
jgi:hypothetical protein